MWETCTSMFSFEVEVGIAGSRPIIALYFGKADLCIGNSGPPLDEPVHIFLPALPRFF